MAIDQNPFDIATWHGDISLFQKKGGKLREFTALVIGLQMWIAELTA